MVLTFSSAHIKMDGWDTIVLFWDFAEFFRCDVLVTGSDVTRYPKRPSSFKNGWSQLDDSKGLPWENGWKSPNIPLKNSGWWFQISFIFTSTWGNDPI